MPWRVKYTRMLGVVKEEGHRVTAPRRALLRVFAETHEPLSIQELYSLVNPGLDSPESGGPASAGEEINLVTVYRFVNLLVSLGLVRRVEFGQGYYRYEREEPQERLHCHHVVCRQCGKVEQFVGCDLCGLTDRLEAETGFWLERHRLEFFGVCLVCQESVVARDRTPPHTGGSHDTARSDRRPAPA